MTNAELWLSKLTKIREEITAMQEKYGRCILYDRDGQPCEKVRVENGEIYVKTKTSDIRYDRGWNWIDEWVKFKDNPFPVDGFFHTGSVWV